MSFNIEGNNPNDKLGEYIGFSSWNWRPIWEYCRLVAPEICNKVKYAQFNDGDGLNSEDSAELSKILFQEIESGATKEFEANYKGFEPEIGGLKYAIPAHSHPFSELEVAQFAVFLKHCRGFKIW